MKINIKNKFYFKIILTLVLAFFLSSYLGKNLFLSYTPKIREDFLAHIANDFKDKTDKLLSYFVKPDYLPKIDKEKAFNQDNSKSEEEKIYKVLMDNLKPVGKGIKAASYKNYSYTEVNLDEVEWVETEIEKMDGTIIKIKVPKRY